MTTLTGDQLAPDTAESAATETRPMAGYMGSNKGASGPMTETALEAARAFFARYPTHRKCVVAYYTPLGDTDMFKREYACMAYSFKRGPKGDPINAIN
ncbi:unnamed protein product [Sphagnum jensenii]